MTPQRLLDTAIIPALAELAVVGVKDTLDARRFMLTIALQESRLQYRRQVSAGGYENGPAASFWQFEKGGGCRQVLEHPRCATLMKMICNAYNVDASPAALWEAMRYQDIVAAAAARLLFLPLPSQLPVTAAQGWEQYLSAWRPGQPHPSTWTAHWAAATAITGAKP